MISNNYRFVRVFAAVPYAIFNPVRRKSLCARPAISGALGATMIVLALVATGGASNINVDFQQQGPGVQTYVGLAAAPDVAGASAVWNAVQDSGGNLNVSNLQDSQGNPTTVDAAAFAFAGYHDTGTGNNLQRDSFVTAASTGISGNYRFLQLDANDLYAVYVYGANNNSTTVGLNNSSNLTLSGGALQTMTGAVSTGTWTAGQHYLLFTVTAPADGEIRVVWGDSATGSGYISGVQFRNLTDAGPDPVTVPEPSVFTLAALGLLGLGCIVLRKKYYRE